MEYRTPDALCGIYKITNSVNGKVYIGQSINMKARWKDHINTLNRNDSHSILLQRAWNKYGGENFYFEILELCAEDMLDEIETKYIELYDARNIGYNIEPGGNSNKYLSEATKQKIREAHLGRRHSTETRRKMSESRTGINNGMYGKTHSEESKRKMSAAKKGKSGHPCSEKQKEAARRANTGKVVSEETRKRLSEAKKGNVPVNKNLNPVYCLELDKVFANPSNAGEELGISSSNIIGCCEGKRKTCGGYHWRYAEEFDDNKLNLANL